MSAPVLLLISHGSRSETWNNAIRRFCLDAERIAKEISAPFQTVEPCFLEHETPSIGDALGELGGNRGVDVWAFPLFLSASSHVREDIPEILAAEAEPAGGEAGETHFTCRGRRLRYVHPVPAAELLAANAVARFRRHAPGDGSKALVLVYYGSKKYPAVWDELAGGVAARLAGPLDGVPAFTAYGGDAVEFSPGPLAAAIRTASRMAETVVVLPMLIAPGVVQTRVIPQAAAAAGALNVVSPGDAILPDAAMARAVVERIAGRTGGD